MKRKKPEPKAEIRPQDDRDYPTHKTSQLDFKMNENEGPREFDFNEGLEPIFGDSLMGSL